MSETLTEREGESLLQSKPDFYADPVEQLAFELAMELEDVELNPTDLVTVNRAKLRAIAQRVLGRSALSTDIEDDEAFKDAWSDFEGDHLTDGNGYAAADVYRRCRAEMIAAWPKGREAAMAEALTAKALSSVTSKGNLRDYFKRAIPGMQILTTDDAGEPTRVDLGGRIFDRWPAAANTPEDITDRVRSALEMQLAESLDCNRVWAAWGYGTMSEHDFEPVSHRLDEIVDDVVAAIVKAPE